jgi:hypothetical protein
MLLRPQGEGQQVENVIVIEFEPLKRCSDGIRRLLS